MTSRISEQLHKFECPNISVILKKHVELLRILEEEFDNRGYFQKN